MRSPTACGMVENGMPEITTSGAGQRVRVQEFGDLLGAAALYRQARVEVLPRQAFAEDLGQFDGQQPGVRRQGAQERPCGPTRARAELDHGARLRQPRGAHQALLQPG